MPDHDNPRDQLEYMQLLEATHYRKRRIRDFDPSRNFRVTAGRYLVHLIVSLKVAKLSVDEDRVTRAVNKIYTALRDIPIGPNEAATQHAIGTLDGRWFRTVHTNTTKEPRDSHGSWFGAAKKRKKT